MLSNSLSIFGGSKRLVTTSLVVAFVVLMLGCSSPGETHMATKRVMVSMSDELMNDPKKDKTLRKYQGVEVLHKYLSKWMRKSDVKSSHSVEVTINQFRIGYGRDHMGIDVVVRDGGKETDSFHLTETTSRNKVVNRLTKSLAKHIYNRITGR